VTRHLPQNPSFRFLQKEAKDLLKAHRRRDPSVCAVLRCHPRFTHSNDAEILASDVSLQEMQHALALEYGFESWAELKSEMEMVQKPAGMQNAPTKCDRCNRAATTHVTDIRDGNVHLAHYCKRHTPADIRRANSPAPEPDLTISISPRQIEWRSDGSVFAEVAISADRIASIDCICLRLPWRETIFSGCASRLKDSLEWRLDRGGPDGKPLLLRFKAVTP
jgi:hypothetical protein